MWSRREVIVPGSGLPKRQSCRGGATSRKRALLATLLALATASCGGGWSRWSSDDHPGSCTPCATDGDCTSGVCEQILDDVQLCVPSSGRTECCRQRQVDGLYETECVYAYPDREESSSSAGGSGGASGVGSAGGGGTPMDAGDDVAVSPGAGGAPPSSANGGAGASNDDEITEVAVGQQLGDLVVFEQSGDVFVTSRSGGSLLVLDGTSLEVVATVDGVGSDVCAIAKAETLERIYVYNVGLRSDPLASTLSVVDARSRTIVNQESVFGDGEPLPGLPPCKMVADEENGRLWLLSGAGLGYVDADTDTHRLLVKAAPDEGALERVETFGVNPRRLEVYLPGVFDRDEFGIYDSTDGTLETVPYPAGTSDVSDIAVDSATGQVFLAYGISGQSLVGFDATTKSFRALDAAGVDVAPLAFNPWTRTLFGGGQRDEAALLQADSTTARVARTGARAGAIDVRQATDHALLVGADELVVLEGATGNVQRVAAPSETTFPDWSAVAVNQQTGDVYFVTDGDSGVVRRWNDAAPPCEPTSPRDCRLPRDADCDGVPDDAVDDVCTCRTGEVASCDDQLEMDGVGTCRSGTRSCEASGDGTSAEWSTCSGAIGPEPETCDGTDEDCNGSYDDDIEPCRPCDSGQTRLEFSWTESGAIEDDQFNDFELDIPYPDDDVLRAVEHATIRIDSLDHAFAGDLEISIESPSGGFVELVHPSGLGGAGYTTTTFDDRCAASVRGAAAPFNGCFAPETPLSALDGDDLEGPWTLSIWDAAATDSGTLQSWTLVVCVE